MPVSAGCLLANMDLSDFTTTYAHVADDDLLCLWAERNTLVPEAITALDTEIQRRGLKKQNAARVKKRLDALAAREENGPLSKQVCGELRAEYAPLRWMARARVLFTLWRPRHQEHVRAYPSQI
jgi:hypothetical protein